MNTTGFPSPAQGYEDAPLDFNRLIVEHPATTFTLRYAGKDVSELGLFNGDLLVVDCTTTPTVNSLVIVRTSDGFECHQIAQMATQKAIGKFSNANSYNKIPAYTDKTGRICLCTEVFATVKAIIRLL